jgi:hypothetical protein
MSMRNGIDGHGGGHFAGSRAAHAVANEEDRPLGAELELQNLFGRRGSQSRLDIGEQEVVLVVLADESHIGLAEDGDLDVRGAFHPASRNSAWCRVVVSPASL